jgi:hypothetical protein
MPQQKRTKKCCVEKAGCLISRKWSHASLSKDAMYISGADTTVVPTPWIVVIRAVRSWWPSWVQLSQSSATSALVFAKL